VGGAQRDPIRCAAGQRAFSQDAHADRSYAVEGGHRAIENQNFDLSARIGPLHGLQQRRCLNRVAEPAKLNDEDSRVRVFRQPGAKSDERRFMRTDNIHSSISRTLISSASRTKKFSFHASSRLRQYSVCSNNQGSFAFASRAAKARGSQADRTSGGRNPFRRSGASQAGSGIQRFRG
jgi:hypothetical protein